ncbi:hypothetical protein [Streptomyces sp. SID8499]|uniref:hypothetical protein n=1 Tax=Streptomyces sp. SID8499 TaxID=2706106 RepID=UPI0013CC3E75|nr:hypothetical protein [Streptomyces sp. SID8499]NED36687.1 hypothetical protein [Streptomyces sp. SID8499]
MADSSAFRENTQFSAYVQRQGDSGYAYGWVRFVFERVDDPTAHVVTKEELAVAIRDFFQNAGYEVSDFTGDMPATLDLPGVTDAAN